MADYPYTNVTGKMQDFFNKVRQVGVPTKATNSWLSSIGYKSKNDRAFLKVLKFLGFASEDGTPDAIWSEYRGSMYKVKIAKAIKTAYADLYQLYPNAQNESTENLLNFFATKTAGGKQVVQALCNTFVSLCSLGDFADQENAAKARSASNDPSIHIADTAKAGIKESSAMPIRKISPSVHIDFQIHLSPEATEKQIEAIFKNMAKYIFDK